tara:strand:+ start:3354 stop:3518 length:165 start_codon:yes stop_codon:yes gene_type:complete
MAEKKKEVKNKEVKSTKIKITKSNGRVIYRDKKNSWDSVIEKGMKAKGWKVEEV